MRMVPALHELELEVMNELWSRSDGTVREVADAINRKTGRERGYTTFLTVLVRLDQKGFARRRRVGRRDVYESAMARDEYLRARASTEVAALVEAYGDLALAHFTDELSRLSPEHRKALRRLARDD